MDLLGSSSQLKTREDGKLIREDFEQTLKDVGGSRRIYGRATETMTNRLFDCTTQELYEQTGSKKRDRSSLPRSAQRAYMAGETAAIEDLQEHGPYGGTDRERDNQIDNQVAESSDKVHGLFRWNRGRSS